MPAIHSCLLPPEVLLFLGNLAVGSCMACGGGLLAAWCCRGASAPLRHGLLLVTLLLLPLAPVLMGLAVSQEWGVVALPIAFEAGEATTQADGDAAPVLVERATHRPELHAPGSVELLRRSASGQRTPSIWLLGGTFFAFLWGSGTFVCALRLARGFQTLASFRRTLVTCDDMRVHRLLAAAKWCGQVSRIPVRESPLALAPLSLGLVRPMIVLPPGLAASMSDEQLSSVLLHEAAHVSRRDHWVALLQQLCTALFWWNPLLWALNARLMRLREQICDDYVLGAGGDGRSFAKLLLFVAERSVLGCQPAPSAIALLDDGGKELEERMMRLLRQPPSVTLRLERRSWAVVVVFGLCLAGLLLIPGLQATEHRSESPFLEALDLEHPESAPLAGGWLMTLPAGFQYPVVLASLGGNRYRLGPEWLNSSGVYEARDGRLAIIEPNDRRLLGFEWEIGGDGRLVLVGQPPLAKTGSDYLGATMVRQTSYRELGESADLGGGWLMRLPAGFEHQVTLTPLGRNRYRLGPERLNSSGVYEARDGRLVIVEPNDRRLLGFEWAMGSDGQLVLVGQPPLAKTGAHYVGTIMVREAR